MATPQGKEPSGLPRTAYDEIRFLAGELGRVYIQDVIDLVEREHFGRDDGPVALLYAAHLWWSMAQSGTACDIRLKVPMGGNVSDGELGAAPAGGMQADALLTAGPEGSPAPGPPRALALLIGDEEDDPRADLARQRGWMVLRATADDVTKRARQVMKQALDLLEGV